jgi:hypothetical protein
MLRSIKCASLIARIAADSTALQPMIIFPRKTI